MHTSYEQQKGFFSVLLGNHFDYLYMPMSIYVMKFIAHTKVLFFLSNIEWCFDFYRHLATAHLVTWRPHKAHWVHAALCLSITVIPYMGRSRIYAVHGNNSQLSLPSAVLYQCFTLIKCPCPTNVLIVRAKAALSFTPNLPCKSALAFDSHFYKERSVQQWFIIRSPVNSTR